MKRFLLVLAACGGNPSTPDAADGNSNRPDATDDFDLDGILDANDNCPSEINVNQGNEDGDKFGDACDPCPVVADDNPANADGDEVADACDPLPTIPGDHIKYFEGFHSDVPAGWEEIGTWDWNNGSVRTASPSAGLGVVATDRTRETVSAALTLDTGGTNAYAGVVDNKVIAGASGVACTITGEPTVALFSMTDAANATTQPYELTPAKTYVVKLRRNMDAYTCSATEGTATATTTKNLVITNSPWVSGLIASNATVRFHWFMVVESYYIAPFVAPAARVAVEHHRQAGDIVVLATGSTVYAARPVARGVGIDHVLATQLEVNAGTFTGKPSALCFGHHKVALAAQWARDHGIDLAASTFYSDSFNDLPLLERVGRAVAVNPDTRLRRHAYRRGWSVQQWC